MTIYGKKIPHLAVMLAGAGVCFVFIFGATRSVSAASRNLFDGSTCGTYTGDHIAGGADDPGVNPPFVGSGEVNPACVSSVTGNSVCHYENPRDCIDANPTPPLAVASDRICVNSDPDLKIVCRDDADCNTNYYSGPCVADGNWRVQTRWFYSDGFTVGDKIVYALVEPAHPNAWQCFYSAAPGCDGFPWFPVIFGTFFAPNGYISVPASVTQGEQYYYSARGTSCRRSFEIAGNCDSPVHQFCENDIETSCLNVDQPGECVSHGGGNCVKAFVPDYRSEIRTVTASYDDYELAVAEPADTHVVTGGTSQQYTVTLTPLGTIAGDVTLTVVWDAPAPNGVNIQWVGGSNTVNPSGPLTRSFTIQTTNNVTTADRYSFHIQGTHATAGDRITPAPNPTLTVQDYTMGNPSANPLNMNPTDSRPLTIDFAWLPAFDPLTQPVTLTNTAYPWLAVSYAPSPISSPAGRVTATLTTSAAPPGDYAFTVTGTAAPSGLVRTVSITIHINPPPDFTISVVPVTATVNQGNAQTYTVTVTPINGFASPVTLAVGGLHASMTGTFVINPLPVVGPPASTTLTVTTQSPATPCGGPAYALTVTGTSGSLFHTAGTALTVNCVLFPDFSLAGAPATVTVVQGTPAVFTITATSIDGYINTVLLSCIAIGGCSFADSSLAVNPAPPPDETTLTIDTAALAIGNHPFQVQGSDGTLTHTVDLAVNVLAPPIPEDFAFDVTPNSLTFTEGDSGTFTVSVTPSGGFSQPVAVSWVAAPPLPASITLAPNPLTMNPGTQALQVQTNIGSAGTYTLDFTASSTTSTGAPLVKQRNGIQIFVNAPAPACGGGCPANQTCTPGGCVADPPADGRCNESLCYDSSGRFREPAPSGCWASWQPCNNFNVLKVRKDRQCNQWLDCVSAVTAQDPVTGKAQNQCTVLGVCDQLGTDGQCVHRLSPSTVLVNMSFGSPADVQGVNSKIRWYSGYSSGFHFSDLGQGEVTSSTIAATYPAKDIREIGLGGALRNLVQNNDFEELRCIGGDRDGLACITTSDCRVGQGTCVDAESPNPVTRSSPLRCDSNADCSEAETSGGGSVPFCRYVTSWGGNVDCRNPFDSKWVGVTPSSSTTADGYEEAGFGGRGGANYEDYQRRGLRVSTTGEELVQWHIWEDEENFEDQTAKIQDQQSPRFPEYSPFKHLKDGNNLLKVTVQPRAAQFSGVGTRVADPDRPLAAGSETAYTLSFRFRYADDESEALPIKAQLSFNYSRSAADGYEKTDTSSSTFLDLGTITGAGTEWKEYVFGPVAIEPPVSYNRGQSVFLNFVTNAGGAATPTSFYLDDVLLKPVLNTGDPDAGRGKTKIARSCRLFPKNDAPGCEYRDTSGTLFKGWRGYCLDKDPRNENLCITWWPLDVPAGESVFAAQRQSAYNGRFPLFVCAEASGGANVIDVSNRLDCAGDDCGPPSDNVRESIDVSGYKVKWRDIDRIDVYAHMEDGNGAEDGRFPRCDRYGTPGGGDGNSQCPQWLSSDVAASNFHTGLIGDHHHGYFYFRLRLDTINRTDVTDGIHMTLVRNGADSIKDESWATQVGRDCNTGANTQYFAARARFDHPDDPNHPDAYLRAMDMMICNDQDDSRVWYTDFRFVIRTKEVCNYLVQTVSERDNVAEEKVWATRLKSLSQYTVPDYTITGGNFEFNPNIRYNTVVAPFGAASAFQGGNPGSLGTWPNNNSASLNSTPLGLIFRESISGRDARAGTPLSFHNTLPVSNLGTCSSNVCTGATNVPCQSNNDCQVVQSKYCTLPLHMTAAQLDLGFPSITTLNSCATNRDIQMCERAGGACVGAPIGRCSLNASIACGSNADCRSSGRPGINDPSASCTNWRCSNEPSLTCASAADCRVVSEVKAFDYGTCTAPTVNTAGQHVTTADTGRPNYDGIWAVRGRISRLFAKAYGCWQYQAELQDSPGPVGGSELNFRYVQNCSGVPNFTGIWDSSAARNWNYYDPNVGTGTGPFPANQCAGNVRPTLPDGTPDYANEYCWVRPTISNVTLGGVASGDLTITDRERQKVTASFQADTDKDQKPLQKFRVLWGYTGGAPPSAVQCYQTASTASDFSQFEQWEDILTPSKIEKAINYPAPGTYRPVVCVRDHWEVVSVFQFPGTVVVN